MSVHSFSNNQMGFVYVLSVLYNITLLIYCYHQRRLIELMFPEGDEGSLIEMNLGTFKEVFS